MGLVGSRIWGMGSVCSGMSMLVHKSTTWPVISGEGLSTWSRSLCTACSGAHRRAALPHFCFSPKANPGLLLSLAI